MSNTKDYTITTLSNNLNQRNRPVFSQATNNSISLRDKCSPYTVEQQAEGDRNEAITKFPFGCLTGSDTPTPPAPKCDETLYVEHMGAGGAYTSIQAAVDAVPVTLTENYCIEIQDTHVYYENVVIDGINTGAYNLTLTCSVGQQPRIDGNQAAGVGECCLWIKDVDSVTVDGIGFRNWSWTGGSTTTSSPPGQCAVYIGEWGVGNGVSDVTIKNCIIDSTSGGKYGVYIGAGQQSVIPWGYADGIKVENCTINGTSNNSNEGYRGIDCQYARNCEFTENIITRQTNTGIMLWGDWSGGAEIDGGHFVKQNQISDSYGSAIDIIAQLDVQIVNNLIYDVSKLIANTSIYQYGDIGGLLFAYNTLVTIDIDRQNAVDYHSTVTWAAEKTPIWKNNIYRFDIASGGGVVNKGPIHYFNVTQATGVQSDYNLFSITDPATGIGQSKEFEVGVSTLTEYYTVATWTAAYGWDGNSVQDNGASPGIFEDIAADDYTLAVGSSALNAGTPIVGITTDILGNPRDPTNPSIGCYES